MTPNYFVYIVYSICLENTISAVSSPGLSSYPPNVSQYRKEINFPATESNTNKEGREKN